MSQALIESTGPQATGPAPASQDTPCAASEPALTSEPNPSPQRAAITALRRRLNDFKPRPPDAALRRDLDHGWMLPLLLRMDACLWGRWDYWMRCCEAAGRLPSEPIPPIEFLPSPHPATRRILESSLDCIPAHSSWRSWSGWSYFDFLLDWLLFGLGHKGQRNLPPSPSGCDGASDRLYQMFTLDAMLLWPHDYFGALLGESAYGRQNAFYPTPHSICEFMTRMVCDEKRDMRTETVCDPAVGSGRFLLHASNHSLRLFGMDIDLTVCKATLVNGYLYAPWLVRPIPWLDGALATLEALPASHEEALGSAVLPGQQGPIIAATAGVQATAAALSDALAAAAPPHVQARLADTEHDPLGQRRVAPIHGSYCTFLNDT